MSVEKGSPVFHTMQVVVVMVTGLSAWVSTVTESAVADAMVPRTRSGVPVAASAADEARAAEAAIARPRIRFGLMSSSPSEIGNCRALVKTTLRGRLFRSTKTADGTYHRHEAPPPNPPLAPLT